MRKSLQTVNNQYFEWLCNFVTYNDISNKRSFNKLLRYLYDSEFIAIIYMDKNRIFDGLKLRKMFIEELNYSNDILEVMDEEKPCSVLEVMIGLAHRCATSILDGCDYGLYDLFWGMVDNLGLLNMHDDAFDSMYVADIVNTFINREYAPNGNGGLFTVTNRTEDLRDVDIWYQLMWYLNEVLDGGNL